MNPDIPVSVATDGLNPGVARGSTNHPPQAATASHQRKLAPRPLVTKKVASMTRRSGRALRKNAPPSRRALPPAPAPRPLPTPFTSQAPTQRDPPDEDSLPPWTNRPPPEALRRLIEIGLAYRFRSPPSLLAAHEPQKRIRFVRDKAPWSERMARTAAQLAHRVHRAKEQTADEETTGEGWVPENGSLLQVVEYTNRLSERLARGELMTDVVEGKNKEDAEDVLSRIEKRMLQAWESGVQLPPEKWEEMNVPRERNDVEDEDVWKARAICLNEIYETNVVDKVKARVWWEKRVGWRPLVDAMQKKRWVEYVSEKIAIGRVRDGLRRHLAWCRTFAESTSDDVERCLQLFDRRLIEVKEVLERVCTPPGSPKRKQRRIDDCVEDDHH